MRALTCIGFVAAIVLIALAGHVQPSPDYVPPRVWALLWETAFAAVVSLAVTTAMFWVIDAVKPIQRTVLPGKDEAELAEAVVTGALSPGAERAGTEEAGATATLFLGLCLRGAARILAVAIIYGVTLWTFAPLA